MVTVIKMDEKGGTSVAREVPLISAIIGSIVVDDRQDSFKCVDGNAHQRRVASRRVSRARSSMVLISRFKFFLAGVSMRARSNDDGSLCMLRSSKSEGRANVNNALP